MNRTKIALVQF